MLLAASPLIEVVPGLMIWTLVCFAITFFVLKKYAFGPIQKTIDERRERIRSSVEEAENTRREARALLEEHKQLMGQAKSEASAILAQARTDAEAQRERAREEVEADRQRRLEETRKQIEAETVRALEQIRAEVADLTLIATAEGDRQGARPGRPQAADRRRDRRARLLRPGDRDRLVAVAPRLYARSLFEAAKETGKLDVVHAELGEFATAVDEVPELRGLLSNPQIERDERSAALREILADADELLRNFVLLLSEKGRTAPARRGLPRVRRARRRRRGTSDRRAHHGLRALGRRGRLDRQEDRAVLRPHRRGDPHGRPQADRRHRPPGRLAPARRQRQGPPEPSTP